MAEVSGAGVILGSPVTDLDRDGDGWRADGELYDAVVLAVPNGPARKLLAPLGVEVPASRVRQRRPGHVRLPE